MSDQRKKFQEDLYATTETFVSDRDWMYQTEPGQSFLTDVKTRIDLIHSLIAASENVDDFVEAEMFLQDLDLKMFTAESDRQHVKEAHDSYANIGENIDLM
jgi:hypothetical protein